MRFRSGILAALGVTVLVAVASPASAAITWTCAAKKVNSAGVTYGSSYYGSATGPGLGYVLPRAREKARLVCVAATGVACVVVPDSCHAG
jgi:hypothetical protein